jgi:hypothetical protein
MSSAISISLDQSFSGGTDGFWVFASGIDFPVAIDR